MTAAAGPARAAAWIRAAAFAAALLWLLLGGTGAQAQLPPPGSPILRVEPPAALPVAPPAAPAPLPPANLPSASLAVTSVAVEGATAYREAELLALVPDLTGPHTSLRAIEDARRTILLHYRDAGFPFVVVSVRAGRDGLLRFLVTEGYIAEVKLSGDIGPAGLLVLGFLNHLLQERPVSNASIEYWLLLAQTIPGVQLQPLIQASEREPGAFTLVAKLARSTVSGSFTVDNRAFRQTGSGESLLTLGLNSLTALGERTEAAMFLAGPSGRQVFGQASEQVFLGTSGLKLRFYAGHGDTLPCCDLAAIGYDGQTNVFGGELSYPLLLSRQQQLILRTSLDALDSDAQEEDSRASGDSLRIVRAEAQYGLSDTVLGTDHPAANEVTVRLSHGLQVLGASANGRNDAGRLNENVRFAKLSGEMTRDQTLVSPDGGPRVSLFGLLTGQASRDILPSAEKFYLGGLRFTRGFYSGEVSGDLAAAATVELRASWEFQADFFGSPATISPQLYVFYDWGQTWENQTSDAGHRLRSFGIGLRTGISPNLRLDVEALRRETRQIGGSNATAEPATAAYARLVVEF